LVCSLQLSAQATSGAVAGTITDPTGAVVPNANVTITDADRGTSFSLTSNASGWYVRNQLPNGRYNLHVAAPGFKAVDQKNIIVNVDRETRTDITLPLGNTQQTVTVEANVAPVLDTDRAEISTTLPAADLTAIPTLSQNVTQLELLAPGEIRNTYDIAANENPQGGQANNVDGLLFGFSNRQIDGADDMDAVLGIEVVNPPADSLDQMKITTSNYDAEFGRAAGGFVEYTTKSGTNQLHGDVFEFLRNNWFDARNPYTEPAGTAQQPLRFNQFGGSIGGPIKKDKLFFFFTYQGQRQRIGSGFLTSDPTMAERGGDLSALGGPVLPSGAINAQAANLLALIPLPNTTVGGVPFYLGTGSVKFDTNQYDGRVDYYLTNNTRMFFRYDYFGSNINTPSVFGPVAGGPSVYPTFETGISTGQNHNGAVNLNHVFSSSLLGNIRFSYFRYGIDVLPTDYGSSTASTAGLGGINLGNADTGGIPNFIFSGTKLSGGSIPGFQSSGFQFGTSINTNAPLHEQEQLYQLSPTMTKQFGNHELKWGGDYRWDVNYRSSSDTSRRGVYTFQAGTATPYGTSADAFESFLLGLPNTFQRWEFLGNPTEHEQDVFAFVQDRWRVTPKLTLSMGVRWELYTAPYANTDDGANFNFATGQLMVAGYGNVDRYTNINNRYNNFAPRIGIAYQLDPNTVIRAGYGRSFFPNFFSIQISHNYPVDYTQDLAAPVGGSLPFTLAAGPPAPVTPVIPSSGLLPLPMGVSATGIPTDRKQGYVDMYNLAIQHEFGNNLSLQLAYVGDVARHLYSFIDANDPVPGPGNSDFNRPYYATNGYTQSITTFCNCFSSNYNSLQVSAEKRMSAFYSLTSQYTWSKVLNYGDNSAEYGPFDIQSQYGPAGFDRTNAFTLGHVVQLPIGKGMPLLGNANGFAQNVLGGWQFTGMTTIYSGRPYTPVYSNNSSLNSTYSLRAEEISNPAVDAPSGSYNPAAFMPLAEFQTLFPFQEGNAGRNSLRGPAYWDADWGLSKTFRFTEKTNLNFAWQTFNVFNHPNRGLPNNNVDSASAGQITSLEFFALPRTMQFSLRLSF
jgi:outer membrane receptor protein involved in Fe transport